MAPFNKTCSCLTTIVTELFSRCNHRSKNSQLIQKEDFLDLIDSIKRKQFRILCNGCKQRNLLCIVLNYLKKHLGFRGFRTEISHVFIGNNMSAHPHSIPKTIAIPLTEMHYWHMGGPLFIFGEGFGASLKP